MASDNETAAAGNFVRDIIEQHLSEGRYPEVVTRFPPEPNGYLHIGHAKAICLDFGMAKQFGGRCHLRMDDTNPITEDTEYVESIKHDIQWLGFDWGPHFFYASTHFERLYQFAEQLIVAGRAYVDSQSLEEIREGRGVVGSPGTPSPYRDRTVEENLDLFRRMRAGEFPDGTHVLRARIDMTNPNMLMRDPLMYRIRHAHHHRTGDAWCIYPMYDYAHGISDAIEGISHSLCTLEFENNRELYDWFVEAVGFEEPRTHQYEFARLELTYVVTSKRKLRVLVEEGKVSGWDDPRMPTLAGVRRRGIPPEAIVDFCTQLGVSKSNSTVDFARFEFVVREHLNRSSPRVMAVLDPIRVIIDNYPAETVEWFDVPYFPEEHEGPSHGSRKVPFSKELFIEREDFMEDPPKKFYRLAPGREVRLRYGYFIRCTSVVKDEQGNITAIHCTHDPQTRGGSAPDGRRVKATLHWVSAGHAHAASVRLYDRLFAVERPATTETDFREELNANSLTNVTAMMEPSLANARPGERFQFERKGYFCVDSIDSTEQTPVFNRTVTLKDAWGRIQKRDAKPAVPKNKAPKKKNKGGGKKAPLDVAAARAGKTPALAAAFDRYRQDLRLSDDDAHLLTENAARSTFFEAAIVRHNNPKKIANVINNTLMATLKEQPIDGLPFGGADLGALVALLDEEVISSRIAKTVLERMLAGEGTPQAIIDQHGLRQLSKPEELLPIIDQVFAANPDSVAALRAGERKHHGFLVGQIMKASAGRANPRMLNQLLQQRLKDSE